MRKCKDNKNEAQFVTLEVRNNIKRKAMQQRLYAQVVKLRRKDLKLIAANKNRNEAKFKFQSQSARSHCWFDLELDCIQVTFGKHEPYFHQKKLDP